MENKKLGQEPAFACECMTANGSDGHHQEGMSKRFYAACAAMQSILNANYANEETAKTLLNSAKAMKIPTNKLIIELSYWYADELLRQENQ